MGPEYINNYSLAKNLQDLNEAIDGPADYRDKPWMVVVVGSGGGKTRLLEEYRQALNQDDSTLVIAITNNVPSEYDSAQDIFVPGDDNIALNFALSVLSRVVSCTIMISKNLETS
jgi:hypothetical protein